MKNIDVLFNVLEKYKLRYPVSKKDQKKILKVKKRDLINILKKEKKDSIFMRSIVSLYYIINNLGVSLTLAGSARLLSYASIIFIFLTISVIITPVYYYLQIEVTPEVKLASVIGEAKIIKPGKAPGAAGTDTAISKDDVIITGDNSFVVIQLEKNIYVKLFENSTAKIDSIIESNITQLSLKFGSIYSRLKKLKTGHEFKIKTPNATASVRGTEFSISYENGQTVLLVKEGDVVLEQLDEKTNAVIDDQIVSKGNKAALTDKITVSNASQNEIIEIENIPPDRPDRPDKSIKKKNLKKDKQPGFKSLEDIKKKYNRIDVVTLYSGKVIKGAIISRGEVVKVQTINGIVSIPKDKIKNTGIE